MAWLLAKKLEMTRIVKDNAFIPITLLQIPQIKVVWVKNLEKDWYTALVLWIFKKEDISIKENNRFLSTNDFVLIREIVMKEEEISKYNVWDIVSLDLLEWIEKVQITWISKWKWFAWAMKRYNFSWWPGGHWSKFHRALWSIGTRKPRRTKKWKKMHWHMWCDTMTLREVKVELINNELSVIWVRWPVPGARNSLITIKF